MAKLKPILKRTTKKRIKPEPTPEDFGARGEPLNKAHPFYFGFFAAAGGITAITLLRAFASASQALLLIIISIFFAAGLNPAVLFLQRRKISRASAVALIVGAVIAFSGLFIWVAIPPLVDQINSLLHNAPTLVADLKNNSTIASLNNHYGFIDALQKKVASSIKDGQLVVSAFGGVLGVGKAVISGAVAGLTILILTLYFLISLPSVTKVAYRLVPSSRRDRVSKLSDAIIYRIGIFVGGQITVAIIAGFFTLILGFALGLTCSNLWSDSAGRTFPWNFCSHVGRLKQKSNCGDCFFLGLLNLCADRKLCDYAKNYAPVAFNPRVGNNRCGATRNKSDGLSWWNRFRSTCCCRFIDSR